MIAVAVALAGGLGAVLRLIVDGVVSSRSRAPLPLGIPLVNITGSFAMALVVGSLDGDLVRVLGTGLLGGFTTFSAASLEVVRLAENERKGAAVVYAAGTLLACVAAATLGLWLTSG